MADEEKQQNMDNSAKQEATSPSPDMDATESARTTPLQDAPAPSTNMDVTNSAGAGPSQEAPATPPNPDATAPAAPSPFSYSLVLPHMRVAVDENMWNRFTYAEQEKFLFKPPRVLIKGNDDIARADLHARQLLEQERLQAIISALQKALDAAKKASADDLQHGEAKLKTLQAQVAAQQQRNLQSANALAANSKAVQHKLLLAREALDTCEGRDTTVTSDTSSGARSPRSNRRRGKQPARHGHRDPSSSPPRTVATASTSPIKNTSLRASTEASACRWRASPLSPTAPNSGSSSRATTTHGSTAFPSWRLYSFPQLAFRNTRNRDDRSQVVDAASALYGHLLRADNQTFTTRSDHVNVMSFFQSDDYHSHVSHRDFRRLAQLTTAYIDTMRDAYANRTNSNVNYDNHQPTAYQGRSSNARATTKQHNDWATVARISRPPRGNASAASTSSRDDSRDRGRDSDSRRKDRNTDRNDRSGHKRDRPSGVTSPPPPRRSAPARPASSAAAAAPKPSTRTSGRDEAKHIGANTTKGHRDEGFQQSRHDRRQRVEVCLSYGGTSAESSSSSSSSTTSSSDTSSSDNSHKNRQATRQPPSPAASTAAKHTTAHALKVAKRYTKTNPTNVEKIQPSLPFRDPSANAMGQLLSATTHAMKDILLQADPSLDFDKSEDWIPGWERPIHRHLTNSIAKNSPFSSDLYAIFTDFFAQIATQLKTGSIKGGEGFKMLLRLIAAKFAHTTVAKRSRHSTPSQFRTEPPSANGFSFSR